MTGDLLHTCYDRQTERMLGSMTAIEQELIHFFKTILCLSACSGSKHNYCVTPLQWPQNLAGCGFYSSLLLTINDTTTKTEFC